MLDLSAIDNLLIEPTAYCNLHCPQCPRFDQEGFLVKDLAPTHIDIDAVAKNLDFGLLPNLQQVTFEGDYGDIMMHPRPMAIFDLFGHVPMTAITNGSMRNTKFWADLARYQNLSVTFSIDGLEDTNHIYRINSNWHTIMSNAQAYIQAGGQAAWKFIVFQHNEHQIDTARAVSQQMGFKDFSIQHSGRSWFTGERWAVKIDGEYQYDLLPSSEIALENGVSTSPTFDHIARIVPKENIVDQCHIVRKQRLYINHLGHVLPCCMVSGQTWRTDIQAQLWQQLVGDLDAINITKRSLKSIAATEFYQHRLKTSLSSSRRHPVCTTFCG